MKFWLTILDPTKQRKVKAFILATVLLLTDKVDQSAWIIALGIFVGGNAYEKIATIKGNKWYNNSGRSNLPILLNSSMLPSLHWREFKEGETWENQKQNHKEKQHTLRNTVLKQHCQREAQGDVNDKDHTGYMESNIWKEVKW